MTKKRALKIPVWICFVIYIILLLKFIILKYSSNFMRQVLLNWSFENLNRHIETANLIPFKAILYSLLSNNKFAFQVLIYNILAFIPMGFMLPILINHAGSLFRTALIAVIFSFIIELIQLVTLLGEFDIDDIILNMAGAIIGYLFYMVVSQLHRYFKGKHADIYRL